MDNEIYEIKEWAKLKITRNKELKKNLVNKFLKNIKKHALQIEDDGHTITKKVVWVYGTRFIYGTSSGA